MEGKEIEVPSILEPPSPNADNESEDSLFEVIVTDVRGQASLVGEGDAKMGIVSAPLATNLSRPQGGEGGVGEGSTQPFAFISTIAS